MDPRSVAHIFHSPRYSKSSAQRFFIRLLVRMRPLLWYSMKPYFSNQLGPGMLTIDGKSRFVYNTERIVDL
jgi:hypothetical protein